MASGGHISRSISQEPEVPTEDSKAESNEKATMKQLSSLIELKLLKPSTWLVLGSVISAGRILVNYHEVRSLFGEQRLMPTYPLLYDFTFHDIKERLKVYRDIPFEDIYSKMKEMEGQNDDEILRAIFEKCDSFKTFWSLMHLPHLDYENRCHIFNLAEPNLLKEETKDAIKIFQEIRDDKDDDDLFDAFLKMKNLFQLGAKLALFHVRIVNLKLLEVSNELFKAPPNDFGPAFLELGMCLDDLIMRKDKTFTSRSLTPEVPFNDLIGARVGPMTGYLTPVLGMTGYGTTGYVVKDKSGWYVTTVGHVILGKRDKWWTEDVKHSSQCMSNFNEPCSCDLKCMVGNDIFVAEISYCVGDCANSGHETALLEPLNRENTGRPQIRILDDQKRLLTIECHGNIKNPQSGSTVYKIGQKSGVTKGTVLCSRKNCNVSDTGLQLNYQLVVKWHDKRFSEPGDSGAPVFSVEGKEIFPFGVLVGSDEEVKESYVSPLQAWSSTYSLVPFKLTAYEDIPKPKNLYNQLKGKVSALLNQVVRYSES